MGVLETVGKGIVHVIDWGSAQLPRPFAEQDGAMAYSQVLRKGTLPL